MTPTQRDEVARILQEVAADGMPHPRNLDAALDAIDATLFQDDDVIDRFMKASRDVRVESARNENWETIPPFFIVDSANADYDVGFTGTLISEHPTWEEAHRALSKHVIGEAFGMIEPLDYFGKPTERK
jgi:hypothetical protein